MTKDGFYVQMHLHTSETSACGQVSGRDMAHACKQAGYDMLVVTDHFMNANIGCPKRTPWEQKVDYLFAGYRAAKEVGDEIGLIVLKGWETFTDGPEYLTYGLDEAFLLDNPDIADAKSDEYLDRVHAAGGFVVHAHPFRKAFYIPDFKPDTLRVDAFEVYNATNDPRENKRALSVAQAHGLIQIAGSDAHVIPGVAKGAMRFPYALRDTNDLIAALRAGDGEIVEEM